MFPPSDNISSRGPAVPFRARRRASGALAALAVLAAAALAACSSAPVKMECRELQMRIDYGDLTNDQLRFALQELEDCKSRLKAAEAKDSAIVDGAERRFTPSDSVP